MSAGNHEHDRTTGNPEKVEPFISFSLAELLRLTPEDLNQLDDLEGHSDGLRTWWALRRLQWAEEEAER